MTLTKAQIVEALFAKNIFTKTQSAQIIDTLFELIKQSLQNGEDVLISGFGKFSVQEKQARMGRNPTDRGADDAAAEESGDIQVLRCSAGGDEWGG